MPALPAGHSERAKRKVEKEQQEGAPGGTPGGGRRVSGGRRAGEQGGAAGTTPGSQVPVLCVVCACVFGGCTLEEGIFVG